MKILRAHKGFTTNSSSASEWVDPGMPPAAVPPLEVFDAEGNFVENSATVIEQAKETPREEAPSPLSDNAVMLFGFIFTILGLFAIERVIRSVLKKKHKSDI